MSNQVEQNNTSFLIFGENGSGKSTISRVLREKRDAAKNGEINNDKDKNGDRIAEKFLEQTKISIKEIKTSKKDKVEWFFFGNDFKVDFSDSRTMFVSDNEEVSDNENVANIREKIELEERNLEVLAREIARYGGSNKNPEGSVARRIKRDFGKNSATFDRVRKEQFNAKGVEVFLEDIVEILKGSGYNNSQYETKELIEKYLENNKIDLIHRVREYKEEISKFRNQLQEVLKRENQENDYKSLISELNNALSMAFFDNERIRFNFNAEIEQFEVLVRNKKVDVLINLSTAEKNLISICWFFLNVTKKIQTSDIESYRIFVDDPISSTDSQNKMGIYCYLKYIINQVDTKNNKVKFVFFTHDMEVFNHIGKLLFDRLGKKGYETFVLKNKELQKIESFNYYSSLMNDVYDFARGEADGLTPYIGNIMRRLVEGYATFNYRMGIIEIFDNEEILDKIHEKNLKKV